VLAQILDRPPGGGRAKPVVPRVDVGAALQEEGHHLSIPAFGRMMKSGCAVLVLGLGEARIRGQSLTHAVDLARGYLRKELGTSAHRFPPPSRSICFWGPATSGKAM
jgi:hypothetical protein